MSKGRPTWWLTPFLVQTKKLLPSTAFLTKLNPIPSRKPVFNTFVVSAKRSHNDSGRTATKIGTKLDNRTLSK